MGKVRLTRLRRRKAIFQGERVVMQQFEFQAYVNDDATVKIPPEVAAQIERDQPARFIVLVPDRAEREQWAELTAEQFLRGYAESDALYDDLSTR
jgi:hypothetical protein